MKYFITLLLTLIYVFPLHAQITLRGEVHSKGGEALPFINVSVYAADDTTKFVAGSITDMQGKYQLNNMKAGKYRTVVSAVGYNTTRQDFRLRMPSTGNIVVRNFEIEEATHNLKDVVVTGTRKTNYVDKSVYTFNKEQVKNARHSMDLLGSMEHLTVDAVSNKVKKLGGGSIQILINGVNATDNDLKMIAPDKVLKVEYYDIPPARYASTSTLINVITKRLDTGWNGGIEATHAFTTGFGNDDVYVKRVIGNNQLSLDYSLRYRNYNDRIISELYQYKIDGDDYTHLYDSKDKFGYTTHDINIKYSYHKPEAYTLQAVLSPNFETNFGHTKSSILSSINQESHEELGSEDEHIRTFNPSANLYFSKMLPHEQEITIDLTGTYYHNKQNRDKQEFSANNEENTLTDNMKLRNHKESLIGEIAYTKKKHMGTLSLGYKMTLASSRSTISNIISEGDEYKYKSGNDTHYIYAEYGNTWKKLLYRIGVGETFVRTYNDDTKFSKWLFTPKVILAYNINNKQNLRFQLSASPDIPTISQLSNNATLTTRELLQRGNPYLHSSNNYTGYFVYGLTYSCFGMQLGGMLTYEKDPISTYYKQEEINGKKYIVSTSENAKNILSYGGAYYLEVKPFLSELLSIKLYGILAEQRLNSTLTGIYKHLYAPFYYSISMRKGAFGGSYEGSIVSRQIDGTYLQQDENSSNLELFYQHKNFRFKIGCYWLFTSSKYYHETLPNEMLQNSWSSKINDNRSMLTIGFTWNFSTGKKLSIDRKIQNSDDDKGTF